MQQPEMVVYVNRGEYNRVIGSVQGPWGVNVQSREYRHVDMRLKTGTLLDFTLIYLKI